MFNKLKVWKKWTHHVDSDQVFEAALNRDHDRLKILLKFAYIDAINDKKLALSALDLAVSRGDHISVKLLLAHGAIPDYKKPLLHVWSKSTLSRAIISGNHEVIRLLVSQGYNLDATFEITSNPEEPIKTSPYNYWYKVVELHNLTIFQLFLECKGKRITNDKWSQRMLFTACSLGSNEIVEYLLDQGVSIESTHENKWTCIFFAVAYMHFTTFQLLVTRGANINHKDFKGRSLLHIIARNTIDHLNSLNAVDITQMLINNGADINATDNDGLTPINRALSMKYISADTIINLFLRQRDIDLTKPDDNGITVLHHPHTCDKLLVKLLCKNDVDINIKDKQGRTPLHFNLDDLESLNVLLEFGADTKVLLSLNKDLLNNKLFLARLIRYRLKRIVAKLSSDLNIETFFAQPFVYKEFSLEKYTAYISSLTNEIQLMMNTQLCNKLTYYDFLHAKKRTCISVAKIPGMHQILIENRRKHGFKYYENMLMKNYLKGLKPLTSIETQAMTCAEKNLNIIFNDKLPKLVTYNIKKYINIEDMITLANMKLSQ